MIPGFREAMEADRRLVILRLLMEAGGEAGESVLEKGLHMLGHRVDRDEVRELLRFLKDADCLVTEMFAGKVMVAKITKRGVSVGGGIAEVEGVAKPSMGI
jgi:hypothetical protein